MRQILSEFLPKLVVISILIIGLFTACKQETRVHEFDEKGYILENIKSFDEVVELEEKFGSVLSREKLNYIRTIGAGVPVNVSYNFRSDTLTSVSYYMGNAPGEKYAIGAFMERAIIVFEKRLGPVDKEEIDPNRAEPTTRIDFTDRYYWKKKPSNNCSANITFNDSGRAGQTSLFISIYFY